MVTYFSEQDLVSFGNFLLSSDRVEAYQKESIADDELNSALGRVNSFDITTWFNVTIKAKKEQQQ